jgi:hypothetical protein
LLARATLVAGVALVASLVAKSAPHDQVISVRLRDRDISHLDGVVSRQGDDEPTAGFSRDFPAGTTAPPSVRHSFSAPNGTYIVVITLRARGAGELSPIPSETSFQRQVSLVGGEVIVSPD